MDRRTGTDAWTNGTATVDEIFVGTTELDLALLGVFAPPPPPILTSNDIDTARGSYLASDLGSTVNPVFKGGVLQTNQTDASRTRRISRSLRACPTRSTRWATPACSPACLPDETVGQPGSIVFSNSLLGGSVTFTGVNIYTGSTTVDLGATLMLAGAGSIATSSGVIDNGTLNVAGVNTPAWGQHQFLSGTGSVQLTGNNTLILTQAADTFAGGFTGSGGVTLPASGAETFTGTSTIGGTLAVDGGTLHEDGNVHRGCRYRGKRRHTARHRPDRRSDQRG